MKNFFALWLLLVPSCVMAQSGTNSPYSQYGLGILNDQSTGFNRGMNGVAMGMHESNQVNFQNPASYANIDSLTFIFDVGAAMQVTNYKEGDRKLNAYNANFEYAVMAFRVLKNLGVSVGIMPFSNIGYNYYTTSEVSGSTSTSYSTSYYGSGGTRVIYAGLGWKPVKPLSIGANIGYFWGSYSRSIVNGFSETNINTIGRYYTADMSSYTLDLGLQYTASLGGKNSLTLGLKYSPGHSLGGSADLNEISTNSETSISDTTSYSHSRGLFIPTTYAAGLAWYYGKKWKVGADYSYQKWGEKPFPDLEGSGYNMVDGILKDRHKFTLGGVYTHNPISRHYLSRVQVRAGVGYATPYITVNGKDGPKELSASLGFGLPITNSFNNRSVFNISFQWMQYSADNLIRENMFRINIGLTFNENWFMKWKVQ